MKPSGTLYFSENEHIIKFEENLKSYHDNAQALRNNIVQLEKLCKRNKELPNCQYFENELKSIAEAAIKETHYVQLDRSKRELICLAVSMLAIAITTAIGGFFLGLSAGIQDTEKAIEQINLISNTTTDQINNTIKGLHLYNMSTNIDFENDSTMRSNISDVEYINHITLLSLLATERHNRATTKHLKSLGNNLREDFFSIIDIYTFNETFHTQKYESPLFSLHPREIIKLSKLDAELYNNTITISIRTPILSRTKYYLTSIIPIPISRDNNNFILNLDAKHIVENNATISEISLYTLAQCIQAANLIVCNSLLLDHLLPIDNCLQAIVADKPTQALCTYKKLSYKTQLVKISDKSIYVHIIKPVLLKISCANNAKIMNITKSQEIYYEKNCNLYHSNNKPIQQVNTTIIKIESPLLEPSFETFENGKWLKPNPFPNIFNNRMDDLLKDWTNLARDYNQRSKILEISNSNPFEFIFKFFRKVEEYTILIIIIGIILIFVLLFICIFRK